MIDSVFLKVVEDRSTGDFRKQRRILTGRGVNPSPAYPGCTGFNGWEDVCLLSNGELLCTFSGGYWHASFPTPVDLAPDFLAREGKAAEGVDAPTGGRALISRSRDLGKTWSQPTTLYDSPFDDRHPTVLELPDGSLLCAMFHMPGWYGYEAPPPGREKNSRVCTIKSKDGGRTWSEPVYMPSPFVYYDRMRSKMILLPGGSVLLATYACDAWRAPLMLGLYRSDDGGESWSFVSSLGGAEHPVDEPAICYTDDGTLLLVSRPNGEFAFSHDEGKTWSDFSSLGIPMIAPGLIKMRDGVIVCLFGRMGNWAEITNSIQIIWSRDNGRTWIAPNAHNGFLIDNTAYLYANCCELPDRSLYVVYYHPVDSTQKNTAVMRIRLRLREDDSGIDLLPIADGDDSLPPALQEDLQPDAKIDADAALPKGNA